MLVVALSSSPTHEDGACNKEMIELLNVYMADKKESTSKGYKEDPRWAKLKNLN
jgi:uncharacterized metal-binding protein YceD (DUF177 family)